MFSVIPLAEVLSPVDHRLFDDHLRMTGRWSKEQLTPDVEKVWKPLFPGRTTKQLLSIARFARSVYVGECHNPGQGCHYPRAKTVYDDRYQRDGDPFDSYRLTTKAADGLESLGLIQQAIGDRWIGKETTVYATDELMDLLAHIDPEEPPALPAVPETVMLRDADGKNAPYKDTPETNEWREKIATISSKLQETTILDLDGNPIEFNGLRIIFNESFDRGGRAYAVGDSWQNMSSDDRLNLRWKINGVYHPVVEIDYSCLHLFMAYAEAGLKPPKGDLYQIGGFGRKHFKTAVLVLLNAKNKASAVGAIIKETGLRKSDVDHLIRAIKKKHKPVRSVFHSDAGARFQKKDGQMALDIMLTMIHKTALSPLSVYDSFLVPDIYGDLLYQVMKAVALQHGLDEVEVKTTSTNTTTPPIPYMQGHSCDMPVPGTLTAPLTPLPGPAP